MFLFFFKGKQIKKFKLLYIIFFFFQGREHLALQVASPLHLDHETLHAFYLERMHENELYLLLQHNRSDEKDKLYLPSNLLKKKNLKLLKGTLKYGENLLLFLISAGVSLSDCLTTCLYNFKTALNTCQKYWCTVLTDL